MSKFSRDRLKFKLNHMFTLPSERMVSYQTRLNKLNITDNFFIDMSYLYFKKMEYLAWDKEYATEADKIINQVFNNKESK